MIAILIGMLFIFSCKKNSSEANIDEVQPNIPFVTLKDLKKSYQGVEKTLDNTKIAGIVTADASTKNLADGMLMIQQDNDGLLINVTGVLNSIAVGDSIEVKISGGTLGAQRGMLQVSGIKSENIRRVASFQLVAPKQITFKELIDHPALYQGILVQVTAAVQPISTFGQKLSGFQQLKDNSGALISLYTDPKALFATNQLPIAATFKGVFTTNTDLATSNFLMLRNLNDIVDATYPTDPANNPNHVGDLYPNFPEDLEQFSPTGNSPRGSYTTATPLALKAGNYILNNVSIQKDANDKKNGNWAFRMQQNLTVSAYLQMDFDLLEGVSKVEFQYAKFGTDGTSAFRLEYSIDGGNSWVKTGDDVTVTNTQLQTATFNVDRTGTVRLRINKLGLGTTGNGRLNIDDFSVYKYKK